MQDVHTEIGNTSSGVTYIKYNSKTFQSTEDCSYQNEIFNSSTTDFQLPPHNTATFCDPMSNI